jgi:hypothetical protein
MIQVMLPTHLARLADTGRKIELQVDGTPSVALVLDALEARYPMLRGTIRDQVTKKRRPFIRFFVTGEDWSLVEPEVPLPAAIVAGAEPLMIIGAMAGG